MNHWFQHEKWDFPFCTVLFPLVGKNKKKIFLNKYMKGADQLINLGTGSIKYCAAFLGNITEQIFTQNIVFVF